MKTLYSIVLFVSVLIMSASNAVTLLEEKAVIRASEQHYAQTKQTLSDLVSFKTVKQKALANRDNPQFLEMKKYLSTKATVLGFDYKDFGEVVVVGWGQSEEKVGVVTHGDVQPADVNQWQRNPFLLDDISEPGKLLGRGTEDDKGAIATALYAMKALQDEGYQPKKRIELIISMTEESDWEPFRAFVASYPVPQTNIVIDSSYPVVVAEKGWGLINVDFKEQSKPASQNAYDGEILSFKGGAFISQVPEVAEATISASEKVIARLKQQAKQQDRVKFSFVPASEGITIKVVGKSAHSAAPQNGINAITHLADLLGNQADKAIHWKPNRNKQAVEWIVDNLGFDVTGKHFGEIAFKHDFMGPMTVSLSTATYDDNKESLSLSINLRIPKGKDSELLDKQIHSAVEQWAKQKKIKSPRVDTRLTDAYYPKKSSHAGVLLDIFEQYTGIKNPEPLSIGGSTHAKLMPNAVGFGPSMPDTPYTGHSEHEFITEQQLKLNLKMYTAMLLRLSR